MNHDTNIYKVIPFSEVKIGQEFEDASFESRVGSNPWVKRSASNIEDKDQDFCPIKSTRGGGDLCLVRISDCEPESKCEVRSEECEVAKSTDGAQTSATVYHVFRMDAPDDYDTASTKQHESKEEASAEALRLAEKHEDCRFAVLKSEIVDVVVALKKLTLREAAKMVIDAQGEDERNAAIVSLENALMRKKGGAGE